MRILTLSRVRTYFTRNLWRFVRVFLPDEDMHAGSAGIYQYKEWMIKGLSHSTAIPRSWPGDAKFLRTPWSRRKNAENRCKLRSHRVLFANPLRAHGVLKAHSRRAKMCHCASTACTLRGRRAQNVAIASAWSYKSCHIQTPSSFAFSSKYLFI